MDKNAKIYVAGHTGLVGSAILRVLLTKGYNNIICKTHKELDLTVGFEVDKFFNYYRPDYVFLSAAIVGGIKANMDRPAEFIYSNIHIQTNVIDASYRYGVKKLLFMGSSCVYPKYAPQPITEDSLLSGILEPTNKAYAIAKISGIVMCESYNKQYGTDFVSVMPTNLYGPNDTYDPDKSHVIPALIKKIHDAKDNDDEKVVLWGTGDPLREFLYSDDLAEACIFLMENYHGEGIVNIGSGEEVTIKELAELVGETVGYTGEIKFDDSVADGTPRKIIDSTKIRLMGWKNTTPLKCGLKIAYNDFLRRVCGVRTN